MHLAPASAGAPRPRREVSRGLRAGALPAGFRALAPRGGDDVSVQALRRLAVCGARPAWDGPLLPPVPSWARPWPCSPAEGVVPAGCGRGPSAPAGAAAALQGRCQALRCQRGARALGALELRVNLRPRESSLAHRSLKNGRAYRPLFWNRPLTQAPAASELEPGWKCRLPNSAASPGSRPESH